MAESKGRAPSELKEVQLAHEGMKLILCSQLKEAEALFNKYRSVSPRLHAGHSFTMFIRAVMNFEDDSLEAAYNALESTEKFCDTDTSFFSSADRKEAMGRLSPHEKVLRRAIGADCLLLEAMVVFLRQSLTSYLKGGYIIRKAWKSYEDIVKEMEKLCDTPCPLDEYCVSQHVGTSIYDDGPPPPAPSNGGIPGDLPPKEEEGGKQEVVGDKQEVAGESELEHKEPSECLVGNDNEDNNDKESHPLEKKVSSASSSPKVPSRPCPNGLDTPPGSAHHLRESMDSLSLRSPIQYLDHHDNRTRAAVYFGYGMMNVILSLIPPKLLRLANLLGFQGNRERGLQALEFCSQSQDMKAPLAKLFLLWYHTIIRHFFALDSAQENAGCDEATRILDDSLARYPTSPIFLYFRGKVHYLRGDLGSALEAYNVASANTKGQKEVEQICLYESGWVHFLQLDWDKALPCFTRLKDETRWSACYYGYLSAIVTGLSGDYTRCPELFVQCTKLVRRKNNNMEKFCSRRGAAYKKPVSSDLVKMEVVLFAVEVMYLWRAFHCSQKTVKEELLAMIDGLVIPDDKPFHKSLCLLLRGALMVELERYHDAERVLKDMLRFEPNVKNDKHFFSFALYELAMIKIKQKQFDRAEKLLHEAKEAFSGYEFEARLNFQVHSSLGYIQSISS